MTAILAAWQSQQLLKIKIPAVVLERSGSRHRRAGLSAAASL
jgi:hypothetical protein